MQLLVKSERFKNDYAPVVGQNEIKDFQLNDLLIWLEVQDLLKDGHDWEEFILLANSGNQNIHIRRLLPGLLLFIDRSGATRRCLLATGIVVAAAGAEHLNVLVWGDALDVGLEQRVLRQHSLELLIKSDVFRRVLHNHQLLRRLGRQLKIESSGVLPQSLILLLIVAILRNLLQLVPDFHRTPQLVDYLIGKVVGLVRLIRGEAMLDFTLGVVDEVGEDLRQLVRKLELDEPQHLLVLQRRHAVPPQISSPLLVFLKWAQITIPTFLIVYIDQFVH